MRPGWGGLAATALAVLAAGCAAEAVEPPPIGPGTTMAAPVNGEPPPAPVPLRALRLEEVASGLDRPTWVTARGGGDRLFITEKKGTIRVVEGGRLRPEPYLDLVAAVGFEGNEQGLLGLAFHPDFDDNGRFLVSYTDSDNDSQVVEFVDGGGPIDPGSGSVVLAVDQPHEWHNGGMVQFGPDGHLWVGLGDGGGIGDRYGNGQRPQTVLGSILRLDVNAGPTYAIPPDNPFAAAEEDILGRLPGAPEVWAYGLRNPYRFSIDPVDRHIYIADVGQDLWEEINVAPLEAPLLNYGWPIAEGFECFEAAACEVDGLTGPVVAYGDEDGCAVIGGPVYRGRAIPELYGHYFYADWCGGWVRSFRYQDGAAVDAVDWTDDLGRIGGINSFGTDGAGEMYVVSDAGSLFKIVPQR